MWGKASALLETRGNVIPVPSGILLLARFLLSAFMGAAYWLFGWLGVGTMAALVLLVFLYARARTDPQD
jgi:hypothetical protein